MGFESLLGGLHTFCHLVPGVGAAIDGYPQSHWRLAPFPAMKSGHYSRTGVYLRILIVQDSGEEGVEVVVLLWGLWIHCAELSRDNATITLRPVVQQTGL